MTFNMIKFCILYIIWTMGDNLHVGCLHSSTIWTVNEKTASPIAILVQGCAYKSQITAHGIITGHKYSWSVILVVLLESLFHCHAKVGNISLVRIVYSFKKKTPPNIQLVHLLILQRLSLTNLASLITLYQPPEYGVLLRFSYAQTIYLMQLFICWSHFIGYISSMKHLKFDCSLSLYLIKMFSYDSLLF